MSRSSKNSSWIARQRKQTGKYEIKQHKQSIDKDTKINFLNMHHRLQPKNTMGLLMCLLLIQASMLPTVEAARRKTRAGTKSSLTDNLPRSSEQCALAARSTLFSVAGGDMVENPIVIDESLYETFPGCSKWQVKDFLKKVIEESKKTSVYRDEIEKYLKDVTVKFTANPSYPYPPEKRGEADPVKKQVEVVVSPSTTLVSDKVEHYNMISTLRHEWFHLINAIKNLLWLPCLDSEALSISFSITAPYLPANSKALLKSWVDAIKQGFARIENGKVPAEIISLYAPRIACMIYPLDDAAVDKIQKDISEKKYSNIVISISENPEFKELVELFPPGVKFNLYVYQLDKQPDGTSKLQYGVIRHLNEAKVENLGYALLGDIKARIFQYQFDPEEGRRGFAYNIAEIDAFIGGLHREIIHTVFPEWREFHNKLFNEAKRCRKPPAEITEDGLLKMPEGARRQYRNEL